MVSKISHSSHVINFIDIYFTPNEITNIIKPEIDKKLSYFDIKQLNNWTIEFMIIYGNTDSIRVYKKYPSYKKDKSKSIFIHIPIPTKGIVTWGVEANQHIRIGGNPSADIYFQSIDANYKSFNSLQEYISISLHKAIAICFEGGFKANGFNIKL